MNVREFNACFRPLVDRAWLGHCSSAGLAPNDKAARDLWYRAQLASCCGISTTSGASNQQQRRLLEHFRDLQSDQTSAHEIDGWSQSQNRAFAMLARKAYALSGDGTPFVPWIESTLLSLSISKHRAPDKTASFDQAMAALAILANDDRWLARTAQAAEVRMRWQIDRFASDLEWLQKRFVDTSYVAAIYRQSGLLPGDLDDAPADQLRKLLAMIDTHIRRLCRDYGIDSSELPSRAHPHDRPIAIREDNRHLHVGHELEHCDPVHVHRQTGG